MLNKFKKILIFQLKQGVSAQELALTCSFGIMIGTFPLFGTTTALCFFVGYFYKLNQPLLQTLNYSLTPLHVLMIPIFIKMGEWILRADIVSIQPLEMLNLLKSDWRLFLSRYSLALAQAVLAWLLTAPFVGLITFYSIKPIMIRLSNLRKK